MFVWLAWWNSAYSDKPARQVERGRSVWIWIHAEMQRLDTPWEQSVMHSTWAVALIYFPRLLWGVWKGLHKLRALPIWHYLQGALPIVTFHNHVCSIFVRGLIFIVWFFTFIWFFICGRASLLTWLSFCLCRLSLCIVFCRLRHCLASWRRCRALRRLGHWLVFWWPPPCLWPGFRCRLT